MTIDENTATTALAFTVSDTETAAADLLVSGSSSNPALVPDANIVFGGSGTNRTVTVIPAANHFGTATIIVTVSDGEATNSDTFVLTVNAVNNAPIITSAATVSVAENQIFVIDIQSVDPDGETEGAGLTYSLTGGADRDLFALNTSTGVLTSKTAPDFENPQDSDANNVYDVQVTVTDTGGLTGVQNISVSVTDINETSNQDFGDAPGTVASPSYPTLLVHDGARHTIGSLFLGVSVDTENDGQPTANADGDNFDDGIQFIGSIVSANVGTKSSVVVTASAAGKLDAWIDFNGDGDWSDSGEQIFTSVDVPPGNSVLTFNVPAGAAPGNTFARFRLSSAGGLSPTGAADDGEVEDYMVTILDGNSADGATATVASPAAGALDVFADGNDVVVRQGTVELLRAPGNKLQRLDIAGTPGDDTFNLADLDAIFAGLASRRRRRCGLRQAASHWQRARSGPRRDRRLARLRGDRHHGQRRQHVDAGRQHRPQSLVNDRHVARPA